MVCPECDGKTVEFDVPQNLRDQASEVVDIPDPSAIAVCTNCLGLSGPESADADQGTVSDALPIDEEAALALLLAASLLESLASNRQAIEALIARVERAGVDPAMAFERLAGDTDLEPAVDLSRRYHQFEQLRG